MGSGELLDPRGNKRYGDHEKSPKGPVGTSMGLYSGHVLDSINKTLDFLPKRRVGAAPARRCWGVNLRTTNEHKLQHSLLNPWHPQWVWMNHRVNTDPHPTAGAGSARWPPWASSSGNGSANPGTDFIPMPTGIIRAAAPRGSPCFAPGREQPHRRGSADRHPEGYKVFLMFSPAVQPGREIPPACFPH